MPPEYKKNVDIWFMTEELPMHFLRRKFKDLQKMPNASTVAMPYDSMTGKPVLNACFPNGRKVTSDMNYDKKD